MQDERCGADQRAPRDAGGAGGVHGSPAAARPGGGRFARAVHAPTLAMTAAGTALGLFLSWMSFSYDTRESGNRVGAFTSDDVFMWTYLALAVLALLVPLVVGIRLGRKRGIGGARAALTWAATLFATSFLLWGAAWVSVPFSDPPLYPLCASFEFLRAQLVSASGPLAALLPFPPGMIG